MRADRSGECPMLFPCRSLRYPSLERVDLFRGERLVRGLRRHPARFLLVRDPLNDEAFGRLARDDRGTRFALGKSSFPGIEPQAGHARVLVGAMAMEARVRQDGPNFTLEINCGVGDGRQRADEC